MLHGRQAVSFVQHIAERLTVQIGIHTDIAIAIVTADLRRSGTHRNIRNVHQRHWAGLSGHRQQTYAFQIGTRRIRQTHANRDLPIRQVKFCKAGVHIAAGRNSRYGTEGFRGHAKFGCPFRQRSNDDFRLQQTGAGRDCSQSGDVAHFAFHHARRGIEFLRIIADQHDLQLPAHLTAEGEPHTRHVAQGCGCLPLEQLLRAALTSGLERDGEGALADIARSADGRIDTAHIRHSHQTLTDLLGHLS